MTTIDRDVLNVEARESIPLSMLLDMLVNNALGELDPPLDQNRINCARILLDKTMPNLKAMEVQGKVDSTLTLSWKS